MTMVNPKTVVEALSGSDLLKRTHELARESRRLEAELLVHLRAIDERKLLLHSPDEEIERALERRRDHIPVP